MIKKIVFVMILLIVAFFGWRAVVLFSDVAKTAVNEEMSIEEYLGTNYSFYYPTGWAKAQIEGAEIAYVAHDKNNEETGEDITFEVSKSESVIQSADETLCQTLAQGMTSVNPELSGQVKSVVVVNTEKYQGCRISNAFAPNGLDTTTEVKMIWYKDGRDNIVYTSQATHFNDTEESLKSSIRDSVDRFNIF